MKIQLTFFLKSFSHNFPSAITSAHTTEASSALVKLKISKSSNIWSMMDFISFSRQLQKIMKWWISDYTLRGHTILSYNLDFNVRTGKIGDNIVILKNFGTGLHH